jgi:hypothetical protein
VSPASPDPLTFWAATGLLVLYGAAGLAVGTVHFRALRASAESLARGGSRPRALSLALLRFGLTALVLVLAALRGTLPLVAVAAGFLVARTIAVRRIGRMTR